MQTYKEFRDDWKKNLSKGQKFDLKKLNADWKEYQKSFDDKSAIAKKQNIEPAVTTEKLEVEAQPQSIIQENINIPEIRPATTTEQKKQEIEPTFDIQYLELIAQALHETIAGLIGLILSEGYNIQYSINKNQLDRLNKFASKLLQKYDSQGWLEKLGLEIAYGVTILGVITEIVMAVKLKKATTPQNKEIEIAQLEKKLLELKQ